MTTSKLGLPRRLHRNTAQNDARRSRLGARQSVLGLAIWRTEFRAQPNEQVAWARPLPVISGQASGHKELCLKCGNVVRTKTLVGLTGQNANQCNALFLEVHEFRDEG